MKYPKTRYWRVKLGLAVIVLLATGCMKEDGQTNDPPPENQEPQETIVLSKAIHKLSIWQPRDERSEEIITYDQTMPTEAVTVTVHSSAATVTLTLKDGVESDPEQLEQLIDLAGGEMEVVQSDQSRSFQIMISNIQDQAELAIGDLEKIRIHRADDYLQYILNQSSLKVPYSLLIHAAEDGKSHIFVSDREDHVVLRFSEAMQRQGQPGTEWLSDTQLRINLQETNGVLLLNEYYSQNGNFVDRRYQSVEIHPIPSRTWLDAASGGNVGWTSRDGYYDYLLFSPDRSNYAGIVELTNGSNTGKQGVYYGIVLESKGQAPIVLEHTIYSDREHGLLPIEWLDNQTLLYFTAKGAWIFHVDTGQSEPVMEVKSNERLVVFQYDRRSDRIYTLTETRYQEQGQEYLRGHMSIYNRNMELLEREENITDPRPVANGGSLPLDLSVYSEGLYVTTFKDGKAVTYDQTREGEVGGVAEGRLIGSTDEGAYLIVTDGERPRLTWWPRGGEATPVSSFAATSYMMFGGDLFARQEGRTNTYFGYNRSRDEWVEWSPNDGRDSWIPNQQTAYYRITD